MSGCTGKLKAKFILNFASPCNINYHRILGTEIKTYTYTEEQLLRYSEYIKYILNNNKLLNDRTKCIITSGNALNEFDNLIYFAKQIKDSINYFYLNINYDSFKKEDIDKIYTLWNILGSKLQLDVFYNLGFEDNTSSEKNYYLKVLISRGLATFCTIKVSPSNIHKLVSSFNEVLEINKTYKKIVYSIILDSTGKDVSYYDKSVAESSLETISSYLDNNPDMGKYFSYAPNNIFRNSVERSLMNGVLTVMTEDGNIYPGYDVQFMTDIAKETFILGNIFEEYSALEDKRTKLLENFQTISTNRDSNDVFKCIPWDDTENLYSIKPSKQIQELHELLTKYLFEKTFLYNEQD